MGLFYLVYLDGGISHIISGAGLFLLYDKSMNEQFDIAF